MEIHHDTSADPEGYHVFRQAVEQLQQVDLWHLLLSYTKSEQEQLLVQESLIYALPAREIYTRHPDRFDNLAEIYRMKRDLFKRLQHNQDIGGLCYEGTLAQDGDT